MTSEEFEKLIPVLDALISKAARICSRNCPWLYDDIRQDIILALLECGPKSNDIKVLKRFIWWRANDAFDEEIEFYQHHELDSGL